jgi:hypothetical protein
MDAKPTKDALIFDKDFLHMLGAFHAAWSSIEQTADFAIGRFLNISHEQAHLLTSGMMFGRKAQLLAGLIARSGHAKKDVLLRSLNKIRGEIRRDWITHAYIKSSATRVIFIYRNNSGEYKVNKLSFTYAEFLHHVATMTEAGAAFTEAVGFSDDAIDEFVAAAENAANRPSTSPQ